MLSSLQKKRGYFPCSSSQKRSTNLLTTPLSSILTHEVISKATLGMSEKDIFLNSDYLQTICVVVHKYWFFHSRRCRRDQENDFLANYQTLCHDSVQLKDSETTFAPVLPQSAKYIQFLLVYRVGCYLKIMMTICYTRWSFSRSSTTRSSVPVRNTSTSYGLFWEGI